MTAGREMSGERDLAAIRRLDGMFERDGIDYWIFGGWAVDFHAGRVTRDHADIDIAIWQTDLDVVDALLVADGWAHTPAPEHDGYTTYTRDGLHVDLAFLAPGEHDTAYTPLESGRGDWPPDSFGSDIRELAGTRAHVVSLSSLVVDKSQPRDDPVTRTKDASDVAVLRSVSVGREPSNG
jgi:hypothetical protein